MTKKRELVPLDVLLRDLEEQRCRIDKAVAARERINSRDLDSPLRAADAAMLRTRVDEIRNRYVPQLEERLRLHDTWDGEPKGSTARLDRMTVDQHRRARHAVTAYAFELTVLDRWLDAFDRVAEQRELASLRDTQRRHPGAAASRPGWLKDGLQPTARQASAWEKTQKLRERAAGGTDAA